MGFGYRLEVFLFICYSIWNRICRYELCVRDES